MWIDVIKNYTPKTMQEEADKKQMLLAYEKFGDSLLTRENTFMHLTSSSMILNEEKDKVLMVFHNIFKSYSWTGGHNDGDPDFLHVAMKEAREETNIHDLKLLQEDPISIEILPVIPHIKRGEFVSAHVHLNVSYLFEASETEHVHEKIDENSKVNWIKINELDDAIALNDIEMLHIYKKILKETNYEKSSLFSPWGEKHDEKDSKKPEK